MQEIITERVKLFEENKALLKQAADAKRTLTSEEQQQYDAREARSAEIRATLDRAEKHAAEERALAESRGRKTETVPAAGPNITRGDLDLALRAWFSGKRATKEMRAAAEKVGFDSMASELDLAVHVDYNEDGQERRTLIPVKADANLQITNGHEARQAALERRGLTVGTTTAGGNAVQDEPMRGFNEALKWYSSVENLAERINTETGAPLPWPTITDTANTGRVLAEETAATTTTDPTVNQVVLSSFKLSSDMVLVSWELLQDSFVDLNAYLGRALGTRLGRIRNTKFTVGAGTTEPKGVIVCAGTGVTAAATNAFTLDEVIDLVHSLDPAYRNLPGTGFMVHDTIAKYLRKFKDGDQRYLWEMSTQVGQPDRLFGYPVTINNDMDSALTTGKKLLFFGNIKLGFIVRDAGATRFQRLDELFARTHQVAFEAIQRADSNSPDATALKNLVLA